MTRKDYELTAAAIKAELDNSSADKYGDDYARGAYWALDAAAKRLANTLATDNPRFDQARFLRACGF